MGKPRGKGPKPASNDTSFDLSAEAVPPQSPGSPLRAVDGHNVDGWADEDIRTYNELLTERAKLEKEKNELEQKSSRHHTQRALLDENATALDSLFKAHLGGDFKFTGSGKCCLDFDVACDDAKGDFPCKHEICSRAKTKGVSWMEMDTIKYYHARIVSEKSQRMQSALRKQRDVELVRVKKDDDEEAAIRTRRNAILDKATRGDHTPAPASKVDKGRKSEMSALDMLPMASKDFLLDPKNSAILEAAKENEHIVRRIRGRLDKIRHDVNAGRVSPADARVKLDQANSEMAEAERKNNEFRQMILDAEPALSQLHPNVPTTSTNAATPGSLTTVLQNTLASSNADAFSQALTVMKGFFSASDPHDVHTAITDLRSVLEINGPMSPVLKKSFNALEDMLAKPNASAFSLNLRTSDGKITTCKNVVEVLLNLRQQNQGSGGPATIVDSDNNVDSETLKSNQECMKVENTAKREMIKQAEKMAEDTDDRLKAALNKIKSKAVSKSPIVALSDFVLDDTIADIMFRRSLQALVAEAETGASSAQQLSAKITRQIISNAQNKPDKYLARLGSVKEFIRDCRKNPPQVFLEAVAKVDDSMPKFVAAQQEKLRKAAAASKPAVPSSKVAPLPDSSSSEPIATRETKHLLAGSKPEQVEALPSRLELPFAKDTTRVREQIYYYYKKTIESGIWDLLHVVLNKQTSNQFFWIDFEQERKFYTDNLRLAAAVPESSLSETVLELTELQLCPARAVIVLVQRITLRIRENIKLGYEKMDELNEFCKKLDSGNNSTEWSEHFSSIATRITNLYGHLDSLEPDKKTGWYETMVVDVLAFMTTFVLGSQNGENAEMNMRQLEEFIVQVMLTVGRSGSNQALHIQKFCSEIASMAKDTSKYGCPPTHPCRASFSGYVEYKLKSLVARPLKLDQKGEMLPEDGAPTTSQKSIEYFYSEITRLPAIWDRARTLTPHLNCMASRKKCTCNKSDKDFSKNIKDLKDKIDADMSQVKQDALAYGDPSMPTISRIASNIALLRQRPAKFAGNQQRVKALYANLGPKSFAEFYPEFQISTPKPSVPGKDSAQAATEATSSISLKEVSVNVPSIQNNTSSTASEKGNLEKDTAEISPEKKVNLEKDTTEASPEKGAPSPTKPKTPPPPAPAAATAAAEMKPPLPVDSDEDSEDSTDPWPMTTRELELRNQLLKFTNSVDSLQSFASVPQPAVQVKHTALEGVTWQVEDMLIGHVEMAYLIAKQQNYHGLKEWMEYYYKNTMPTPLDDNFKVKGGKAGVGGSIFGASSASEAAKLEVQAQKAREKNTERLRQLEQFTESLSPASASGSAAVVEPAESAVGVMEQLGRNFSQQRETKIHKKRVLKWKH
ncbi:hypothetical protein H2200_008265 [Cladophialophora chaetospira]|uniref:Uncharacterized protein n=1 Tax=Cladophialophora chaetospira TaxID=386627 RepID=A0AA39CGF9_9EURO|nr:hypothetical protein H2200_008265 [Cladophialophora chaetospira]